MFKPNSSLRNLVLKYFPFIRDIKRNLLWGPTVREWQKVANDINLLPLSKQLRTVVILPPDPYTLRGSRGDDAMIEALLHVLRSHEKDISVYIITASEEADEAARKKGLSPVRIWAHAFSPKTIALHLKSLSPDVFAVIGADVMDGYYNPYLPFHALMFADIASRLGARSAVMGFSFNREPWKDLKNIFELTNSRVVINLRDSVSLKRFENFCTRKAQLVADSAFLLEPNLACEGRKKTAAWVKKTQDEGRKAFIFNIHPMLFKNATAEQINTLVSATADTIASVTKVKNVNWLLLPHDFRDKVGDNICLAPLASALDARGLSDRFVYFPEDLAAPDLKAIAGEVDGTLTARMHLAIASLGMGVPVASLTYQDKFSGLLQHFGLPEWLLLEPSVSEQFKTDLETLMLKFIDEREDLARSVREQLPNVKSLAMKNFLPLFPHDGDTLQ